MGNPKRILVRGPNFLGDHVMAFSFYQSLRKNYMGSELVLCVPENLAELDVSAFFDRVVPLTLEERRKPSSLWRAGKRVGKADLAITLPASISSALFLFATSSPVRVGFSETLGALFLTSSLPWKGVTSGKHKSELYLELADWLGMKTERVTPASGDAGKEIVVAPGASIPLREWPYFQDLLRELSKKFPTLKIRVVGREEKWHGFLDRLKLPNVIDGIGRSTLPELVEVCRNARLVIANDSGVAHLASQVSGAPVAVLFGPGDPRYVRPLGESVTVFRKEDLPCSPCESARCRGPYGYRVCLSQLPLESVLEKVTPLI